VCKGGNFVLNVSAGPDGIIPLNQQETLLAIGRWMEKNNKAILNSEPLSIPGSEHSFTRNGKYIYAFQYGWSKGSIKIRLQEDYIIKNCNLLGYDSKLVWKQQGPDLLIFPPGLSPDNTQLGHVYVYQIELELN